MCDKGFFWNPSNCECDKSYDVGEYLDYENWKCINRLVDQCVWVLYNIHCIISRFLIITISIRSVFIYFHWFLKRRYTDVQYH